MTLAATIGAFKLSETIAVKSLAAPLGRAELFWLRLFALLLSAKLIPAVFENQAYDALVLLGVLLGLAALSQNSSARPSGAASDLTAMVSDSLNAPIVAASVTPYQTKSRSHRGIGTNGSMTKAKNGG